MGLGVSLILIAGGAILAWAVHAPSSAVDVNTIGYILLVVGIVGGLASLVFWSSWAGPGYFTRGPAPSGPPARGRRTVVEEDEY